jgi:hypothetical protein
MLWLTHSLPSPSFSSLPSSPPYSCPLCFAAALTMSLSVMCWKPSLQASLCSHYSTISSSMFSKILIANTTSRISDFLMSSLEKPCKSSSSRSGTRFLHDQTLTIHLTLTHEVARPARMGVILSLGDLVVPQLVVQVKWVLSRGICVKKFSNLRKGDIVRST